MELPFPETIASYHMIHMVTWKEGQMNNYGWVWFLENMIFWRETLNLMNVPLLFCHFWCIVSKITTIYIKGVTS